MRHAAVGLGLFIFSACGREGAVLTASGSPSTVSPGATIEAPTQARPPVRPADPSAEPSLVCRNSLDPACGSFYWDPQPDRNGPLTVEITFSPRSPRVGEQIVLKIRVRDDTGPAYASRGVYGEHAFSAGPSCGGPAERYGPWAPPTKVPFDKTGYYKASYDKSGRYTVSFTYDSGQCNYKGYDPYAGEGTGEVVVVVTA